ncbi:MAG: hypothetical protein GY829_12325, partial [Gammaproteobacteria bacterium]|nr:hypothetical protein [Gammaproteobacteria bacterium]
STGNTTKDITVSESYDSNSITTGIDYELEFMGAAFNKFTDEIIVAVKKTVNGQYDGDISGMPMETTTAWSKNITNNCTDGDNVSSTNSGSHSYHSSTDTIDALQTTLLINNIPLDSMVLPYYHHVENSSGAGGDFIAEDCPNIPTAKGTTITSQSTSFGEFAELRIVDLSMLVFLLQFNETTDVRAGSNQDTYNYENYYLVTNGNSQLVKSELVTEYHYPYTGSGSSIFTID